MNPLLIVALIGGGALLLAKGLGKHATQTQAQATTQQGAAIVVQAGNTGSGIQSQLSGVSDAIKSTEFKAITGAAGAGVTAGAAAAASAGSTGAGVIAGAATFGIGLAVGVAIALWSKHLARIKGAKNENAQANFAVAGWKESLLGIVAQYNSGAITDLTTVAELQQLRELVFDALLKSNHVPGVDWAGGGSQPGLSTRKYWSLKCDKHCTVDCCIFNNVMGPAINNTIDLVMHKTPTKTINIPKMYPSKYGFTGLPSFSITVTR